MITTSLRKEAQKYTCKGAKCPGFMATCLICAILDCSQAFTFQSAQVSLPQFVVVSCVEKKNFLRISSQPTHVSPRLDTHCICVRESYFDSIGKYHGTGRRYATPPRRVKRRLGVESQHDGLARGSCFITSCLSILNSVPIVPSDNFVYNNQKLKSPKLRQVILIFCSCCLLPC